MEEEEKGEVDVERDELEYQYVVGGDQDGHHVDDAVVFMEKGWNGRSDSMSSNHHNHATMEFIELWSQSQPF